MGVALAYGTRSPAMLDKKTLFWHNEESCFQTMQESPRSFADQPILTDGVPASPKMAGTSIVSTPKAIVSSLAMAILFVLGLALIQILFHRATPDGDSIVRALEYCSMGAGYCLLALPMWGIFDTLRRTHLYVTGPKYVIAFGYVGLMGALLYFAYKMVLWSLASIL